VSAKTPPDPERDYSESFTRISPTAYAEGHETMVKRKNEVLVNAPSSVSLPVAPPAAQSESTAVATKSEIFPAVAELRLDSDSVAEINKLLLAAAMARIREGLYIGPLDPTSKRPMSVVMNPTGHPFSKKHNGVHGWLSATNGPAREYLDNKGVPCVTTPALKAWLDAMKIGVPAANIFVSTELSILTVADFDEGLADEGELVAFCSEFNIPITRCIRSGRRTSFGAHLYFAGLMQSGHFAIPWRGKIVSGEIKSRGVYVVAEGSFHNKSGEQYSRLWDLPLAETPVALFTALLEKYKPAGTEAKADPDAPRVVFDGASITQERFEECLTENKQDFTYGCYNAAKARHEYYRDGGCPWDEQAKSEGRDLHTGENAPDSDFAIYFGENGFGVHCVHETCKTEWTVKGNGWQSYKAWMKKINGFLIPFDVKYPRVDKSKCPKKGGALPFVQGVSGATMSSPVTQAPAVITTRKTQRMSFEDLCAEAEANKNSIDVIESLVARGTVNINIGDSSIGKTPFLFQEALCVAHDIPFIGQKVTRGRALIIDYENHGDTVAFLQTLAEFLKLDKIDPEWLMYLRHQSFDDMAWEIEDYKPSIVIIDSLRGLDPKAEKENTAAAELITKFQRIAQKNGTAFEIVHHPRKEDRNQKAAERPNLFDLERPVMEWLQESSGALALINQTHTRMGFQKPPKGTFKGTDLGVRGCVKARGETGLWHIRREYNDLGTPIGYVRVTGEDQLSKDDQAVLHLIPVGQSMGFSEMLKHVWEDDALAKKKKPYFADWLKAALAAGCVEASGKAQTSSRKYTRKDPKGIL
jgi:hypothetical protein